MNRWRTLNTEDSKFDELVADYKKRVELELATICKEVLSLLEDKLLKSSQKVNQASLLSLN